jgi:hypothetical protein
VRAAIEDVLVEGLNMSRRVRARLAVRTATAPDRLRELESALADAGLRAASVSDVRRTGAGATIFLAHTDGERLVVKTATSYASRESVACEEAILLALADQLGAEAFRSLLPVVVAGGEVEGIRYLVTSACPGRPLRGLLRTPALHRRGLNAAANVVRDLHLATGAARTVVAEDVRSWAGLPLARLAAALPGAPVGEVEAELAACLTGGRTLVGWIHGDYWGGNVLVSENASTVVGIVDWDLAEPGACTGVDGVHLVVTSRCSTARRQFGDVVAGRLRGEPWATDEAAWLDASGAAPEDPAAARGLLLLAWLRHVSANLGQSTAYARRRVWMRRNVHEVLDAMAETRVGGRS